METRPSNVVSSQISLANALAYALIDSEASHSFIAASFIKKFGIVPEILSDVCSVSLPSGENIVLWFCFKAIPIKITGCNLAADLLVLEMIDYDVMLGIDWLS